MKKSIIIIMAVLILVIGIGVYASNTSSDPIISLSYFEKELSSFKKEVESLIDEKTTGASGNVASSNKYEIVEIAKGKQVSFSESTEFVVRRGTAIIVDPSNVNGIPNLTTGKDDKNNLQAGLQQLYLIPRDDGRGLIAKTDLILMVRGSYKIK